MVQAHFLPLAIDRLNLFAKQAQIIIVSPGVEDHVLAACHDQANTDVIQEGLGVGSRDAAFVTEEPCTRRQDEGQFMNSRQIGVGSRQHLEDHWDTVSRANQLQSPQ